MFHFFSKKNKLDRVNQDLFSPFFFSLVKKGSVPYHAVLVPVLYCDRTVLPFRNIEYTHTYVRTSTQYNSIYWYRTIPYQT